MTPEQRHDIILRSQQGQSIRAIARELQMSPRTVSKALREQARSRSSENSADTPVSSNARRSKLEAWEGRIRSLLERYPKITSKRILEELQAAGYRGGDQLTLWSRSIQQPLYAATKQPCDATGIPIPWLTSPQPPPDAGAPR